jgi:hypothetical protein
MQATVTLRDSFGCQIQTILAGPNQCCFGATCLPFVLNATILKHLSTVKCNFAKQISKDFYFDTIISSVPDKETLMNFYKCNMSSSRKLDLYFVFGHQITRMYEILREQICYGWRHSDKLTWNMMRFWELYTFSHRSNMISTSHPLTKRELLIRSASIFDTQVKFNPFAVRNKICLHSLW